MAVRQTISKPTLVKVPARCVLEAKTWRVKGVEHIHMSIRVPNIRPEFLPAINISWPTKLHRKIIDNLKYVEHVKVPLINVQKWEKEMQDSSNMDAMSISDLVNQPYMASGSGGVALIISLAVLTFNIYMYCCKNRFRGCQNNNEGTQYPQSPTAPMPQTMAMPNVPQQVHVHQAPPPYQIPHQAATVMTPLMLDNNGHDVRVTVTPDQIAKIMGMQATEPRPRNRFAIEEKM